MVIPVGICLIILFEYAIPFVLHQPECKKFIAITEEDWYLQSALDKLLFHGSGTAAEMSFILSQNLYSGKNISDSLLA